MLGRSDDPEIQDLCDEIAELKRQLANLPARFAVGGSASKNVFAFKVISISAGGGKYYCNKGKGRSTAQGNMTNVAMPEGLTFTEENTHLVINPAETTGHAFKVGDIIVAMEVPGIASVVGSPATKLKIAFMPNTRGLPAGTGKYKVLQILDDLNPGTVGWEYPRFHSGVFG